MILKEKNNRLVRANVTDLTNNAVKGNDIASSIVKYYRGDTQSQIAKKMATRYCSRISKAEDGSVYNSDPVEAMRAAVNAGLFEIISTGIMKKIVLNVANLTSGAEFSYTDDAGNLLDEFAADMKAAREQGNFTNVMQRLDQMSVAVGSAVLFVQVLGNKYSYQAISPDNVILLYNGIIEDSGELRAIDTTNIDEATAVIINTGPVDRVRNGYVAFFGRSDTYPRGRLVKYVASSWKDIPAVNSESASEHYDKSGEIGNPFTILQDDKHDYTLPEYPVAVWYGGSNDAVSLLPVDTELYDNSLEIDLANSRILLASLKSATGMVVFSRDNGASPIIPDNLGEGVNILGAGQSLNVLSVPAVNAETAGKIVADNMAMLAEAYGLPSYKLAMSKMTQVPSGAALNELDKPAQDTRQRRAGINSASMNRIFNIEMCLARIDNDDKNIFDGISQRWTVQPLTHETELDRLEEAQRLKDLGITDNKELVKKVFDDIDTDEEAEKYLEDLEVVDETANPTLGRFGVV